VRGRGGINLNHLLENTRLSQDQRQNAKVDAKRVSGQLGMVTRKDIKGEQP
jgi:hypothetical protein